MAESDFTRFYNESEDRAKKISLKIEDIGLEDEVDVTVEDITLCNNIVNYAQSPDNESQDTFMTAEQRSTVDNTDINNNSEMKTKKEDSECDTLPKPFKYDDALKSQICMKTMTYSEEMSEEGNLHVYNFCKKTMTCPMRSYKCNVTM